MNIIFDWSASKNETLKLRHGVGFEDVVVAFQEQRMLADTEHPNQDQSPHQRLAVVMINEYAYAVPYVMDGETRFLKTLFPSRKLQKQFVSNPHDHEH